MIANQAIKHVKQRHWKDKSIGKEAKQTNMWRQNQNKRNKKLGFLDNDLRMQEQACVRRQDYAYAVSCPKTLKTPKIGQNLKMEILTT